jgi:FkbM family methyltransferase
MSFVSYAQNFEDVMLYRALKGVEKGFYIDVGANDPIIDSVTKAFYERGWHGVNIDPSPISYAKLVAGRPRDVNLNIAVGGEAGSLTFYDVAVSGWSTLDKSVAETHKANGTKVDEREVRVQRLLDICEEYAPEAIHFLKIDVEGAEDLVFAGMVFEKHRPWILVVEATMPNSPILSECRWESGVVESGYRYVYFDGLNRYYVADEHTELCEAFTLPPNVFDDFVLYRIDELTRQISAEEEKVRRIQADANVRIHEADTRVHEANVSAHHAHVSAQEAHLMLQAMMNSFSWKITAPLRILKKGIRDPKWFIKKVLVKVTRSAARSEWVKKLAKKLFSLSPALSALGYKLAGEAGVIGEAEVNALSPVANRVRLSGEETRGVLAKIKRRRGEKV